ncbi:hypothetical protein tloyanaT_32150 [Thalassotalea loyana]|uniref:BD-FAE-like domain-containing protein n=1 Tax=Thalassotalea loyana TaxID=280483 RepID=A0ABQ6HH81_9GAMM|nr:alpha/beta hydrolase [Thalassotalea loyana]GLX86962.1 hypothetical protein tloyanaT_32150 [Thalassotalea loyana]
MKLSKYFAIALFVLSAQAHGTSENSTLLTGLHENIPIGKIDDVELSINIAFPEKYSAKPRPVILLVHGGGFISGDKSRKNKQIVKFSTRGFVAASAMYRLAPKHKFPSAIEDIKLAVRFLKANADKYHIDPERIIVSGSSAGSYLAVMVGVTGNSTYFSDHGLYTDVDSSVRAVAAQSSPIPDLTNPRYAQLSWVKRLMPENTADKSAILAAMSPVTYLDVNDPPFFLSHGDEDPVVPVELSREFVLELEKIDHVFEYHEVKGGTHSYTKSAPKQGKVVFSKYLSFINKWSK